MRKRQSALIAGRSLINGAPRLLISLTDWDGALRSCMYVLTMTARFFRNSWKQMSEVYGQEMGYRYMLHPDSGESSSIPVGNRHGNERRHY